MSKKRITVKLDHPNPLFEMWLREWRDKAIETDSKMQYCYGKALLSLQRYPLLLSSGRDCIILQGFGEKLCKMLDDKLIEHKKLNSEPKQDPTQQNVVRAPERVSSKIIQPKVYIPALRSGAWAILLTLYKKSLEPQYPGFLFKSEIIKYGKCLCDKSFIKPDAGSYYTAWSSMKTLLEKNLVAKVSSPAKFSLTDNGRLLGHKLYSHNLNSDDSEHSNIAILSSDMNAGESVSHLKLSTISRKKSSRISSSQSSSSLGSESIAEELEYQNEVHPTSNLSQQETFICGPHSFDIILLVDKMEVAGNRHPLDDTTMAELINLNIAYEVRHLKVGDYTWICREHCTSKELVLPYIVERKRMDDFGKSIKDGRFHEQKFRLKQCGIQNLIYLIESFGNNTYTGLPLKTLEQAAINTLTHDGFNVKFTDNTKATIKYLAFFTNILKNIYVGKTLVSCPKDNLSQAANDEDLVSLITFHEFNIGASKNKNLKVQDMFVRMLLQLKGMSVDKALAVVEKYQTPKFLTLTYNENTEAVNERLLANLEYGNLNRKLGPSISKTIYQLFTNVMYR